MMVLDGNLRDPMDLRDHLLGNTDFNGNLSDTCFIMDQSGRTQSHKDKMTNTEG